MIVTPAYFEGLYARDPDPWQFTTSDYEREKYAATMAALPERRFRRAFEVGSSIGVLSRQLAGRCDQFVGSDVVDSAVEQARARCADLPHVAFDRMTAPAEWPDGVFDLIVFSEVLYYLMPYGLENTVRRTLDSLAPDGVVLLVNWRGGTEADITGEDAALRFIDAVAPRLRPALQQVAERYRIDVLVS